MTPSFALSQEEGTTDAISVVLHAGEISSSEQAALYCLRGPSELGEWTKAHWDKSPLG